MNRKTYRVLILTNTTQIKRKNNTSQEKNIEINIKLEKREPRKCRTENE